MADVRTGPAAIRAVFEAGTAETKSPRPVIKIVGGELPRIVNEAENALLASLFQDIYQRAGLLVRPMSVEIETAGGKAMGFRLIPVVQAGLIERFTEVACFEKFLIREKKWIAIDCPKQVAETYLARAGNWRVPSLAGVVHAPTLRSDGSILDKPGFDRTTGLLFEPHGVEFPQLPRAPNKDDAKAALSFLKELIAPLNFVEPPDRAVALAGLLTPGVRRSLPHAPLFAYSAPVAGSGKSKAVDVASIIWCGHPAPVTGQGDKKDGGELEKRLHSSLIAGDTIVTIDNCEHPLASVTLCQALTQPVLRVRQFNTLCNLDVPSNSCFFATGNNLVLAGDLTRRSLLATLDPKHERPETRIFDTPPPDAVARRNRAHCVTAALTVLRAYVVAGKPRQEAAPLGGYEEWSGCVRDALLWLGEADACLTMEKIRANDPVRMAVLPLMEQWAAAIGSEVYAAYTAREVVELAKSHDPSGPVDERRYPDFYNALLPIAGEKGGTLNSGKLGYWLRAHKDRIFGGRRFVSAGEKNNVALWRLELAGGR
jgi:hypothetical protein